MAPLPQCPLICLQQVRSAGLRCALGRAQAIVGSTSGISTARINANWRRDFISTMFSRVSSRRFSDAIQRRDRHEFSVEQHHAPDGILLFDARRLRFVGRRIQGVMAPYSEWLHILAWVHISICLACALGIAIHTIARPQKMWIMGLVWPITGLYIGPVAVYMYRKPCR